MQTTLPANGQVVVVQFGPTDISFTRCEAVDVGAELIGLHPIDPLSGLGRQADLARLVFKRAGRSRALSVFCAEDATEDRLVVAVDRRAHPRQSADFTMDLTIVGEVEPLPAELIDLSMGGLRANVRGKVPVGLKASIKLGDQLGLGLPTRLVGEVVGTSNREVRMQFISLNESTIERLQWMLGEISPADA